ncbi:MAG TPA: SoxR reducing system RseC family protein [Gallionella sp.]|jgi:sigma-E factor negative regulatory protein RseC|nr:SoxR reducing system RseC family protein [Gallionella sp.]
MLETRVIVVQVDGKYAFVQSKQGSSCGQCSGKGCGSGKLSQLFSNKPRQFRVDNSVNAAVGDEVIVSVAEGAVLRGIGLVYLLPLLLLFMGATLGSLLATQAEQRDIYGAIGALFGLATGFMFAKWTSSRQPRHQNLPFIARQCGRGDF